MKTEGKGFCTVLSGIVLRHSSIRSAMFIEPKPRKHHPSSVRVGMFVVQCLAKTVHVVFISMPLLTELVSSKAGFNYRHGAPNGAVLQASNLFHQEQRIIESGDANRGNKRTGQVLGQD